MATQKGDFALVARTLSATTQLSAGRVLMDIAAGCPFEQIHSFMLDDGAVIGAITAVGTKTGFPPPGAPASGIGGTGVLLGGSGEFLGIHGQAVMLASFGVRSASIMEDAAYQRLNEGGKLRWFMQIIPTVWPEALSLPAGPAVYHAADFSPVTPANPASAGETLIMALTVLGPIKQRTDPGQPFPSGGVSSPVEVEVNGKSAAVANKIGTPALTNVYRIDFIVPASTAPGTASVVPRVAWINGPEVTLPVR